MRLTDPRRERMAGRARTLQERLDVPADGPPVVEDPGEWLEEWRDWVADGDPNAFEARLDREGLSEDECRRRLASHGWPDDRPLPGWVDRIADLVAFVDGHELAPVDPDREDVPFVEVLSVIVAYARERFDPVPAPVEESAQTAFDDWLYERLQSLSAHSLFIEFKTYVAHRDEGLAFAADPAMPEEPRRYYDGFVADFLAEGLADFFVEYAFLARLLAAVLDQWVGAVEEFHERLAADRDALDAAFGPEDGLGPVVDVEALGDLHGQGRNVFGVTFASETKVAYKPRDVSTEDAFFGVLDWLNATSDLPDHRSLAVVPRDGYGWMEWAEPAACESSEAATRYYRRAGSLICLLYALNFTDGHLENVLAAGEHPVLVDLETVLHPDVEFDRSPGDATVGQVVRDSVLRTHFLPTDDPDSNLPDVSGFGTGSATTTGFESHEFTDVNTDVMDLQYRDTHTLEGENLPVVDGTAVEPDAHADEIVRGFEETYRFLQARSAELLADDGPLSAFADATVRLIYRRTRTYVTIVSSLRTPEYLETGLRFGCKAEVLAKPFARGSVGPEAWPIYEAERAAMARMDVPRLTVPATSTEIHWEGPVADVVDASPFEQLRARIEGLDDADRREQLAYLAIGYGGGETHGDAGDQAIQATDERPDPAAVARDVAEGVFERTVERADNTDGGPDWPLVDLTPGGSVYVHSLDDALYRGRVGVALFAAALASVTDSRRHREFATNVVAPTAEALSDDGLDLERVGGANGLGSVVYGFTKLGELLGAGRYTDLARRAAEGITPQRIEQDGTYDVMGGSAGAVLGLLALHDAIGDRDPLDRAVAAGEHLLANREDRDGTPVWTTVDDRPLTGISHGVDGIAYALDRLADATGEDRFRAAAMESLSFSRSQYDADERNWPDRRTRTDFEFMDAWCHGRSGVGLARLEMAERDEQESIRRDVERALSGVDPTMLTGSDHCCCGNFGRIEFLLRAGRSLDPAYREQAADLAGACVERARANGGFETRWGEAGRYDPGFFTGETGIAYTLLRFAEPSLPCVLLWE